MKNIDFEDEIIIKYHKFNFIPFQIFFCIYFVFCFYIEYFEYPNLFKRLLIVLLGIAFINVWFKEAYIIKFNKYGCKIKNLFFYKRYKWEEIVSIKYEYYCQYQI